MRLLQFKRRLSTVAVEFGACSLRAVQLRRAASGWQLHHWINVETEPETPEPPEPDHEQVLQFAFGPGAFSGRHVSLVLSPPELDYHLLELPPAVLDARPEELRTALTFELDRQMSWPAAESELAAWPVVPGKGKTAGTMVVAARREALWRLLKILESRSLECVTADMAPNGIVRVCRSGLAPPHRGGTAFAKRSGNRMADRRPEAEEDGGDSAPQTSMSSLKAPDSSGPVLWGALDVGFRSCRLYLIQQDRLVYARVLRGGGRELTEALAQALHVEFRIAEQYKRVYGIRKTDRGYRSMAGGLSRINEHDLPSLLYAILRPVLDALANEITRSYQFAAGRLGNVETGPLYLLGGGGRLQGLVEVLSERLGLRVSPIDPYALVEGAAPMAAPAPHLFVLSPCIGVALAEGER